MQKQFREGNITVNEKPVKASYKLSDEDEITVQVPDSQEPDIWQRRFLWTFSMKDEQVLVVNKPKGMVVHPSAGHYTGTLVNALMFHCKDHLSGINGVLRPGIVRSH